MGYIYIDLDASYLCDDEYDLRHVMHLDGKKHKEDNNAFVDGAFLYAKKQGSVVRNEKLTDRTYASLSEMAEEFRELYGEYLPSDFDYVRHLCHFLGAQLG